MIERQDSRLETLDGIKGSSTHLKRVKVLQQETFATQRTLEADAVVTVIFLPNGEVNPHRLLFSRSIIQGFHHYRPTIKNENKR